MLESLRRLKFGYIPYQLGAQSPGDRRRFPAVAEKLGLDWECYRPEAHYDVLFVTSNADLTHFRRWPQERTKIVYDMVDSYLDVPDWEPKALIRGAGKWLFRKHRHFEVSYRKTVQAMCQRADLVVCSTPEQRTKIAEFNRNVHPILDFHEELGQKIVSAGQTSTINIFWEGLGLTASQFSLIAGVLRELSFEFSFRLHFVTDLEYRPINTPWPTLSTRRMLKKMLGPIEFYLAEWNPTTIQAIAGVCDLGVIPLRLDKPLFRAKPENKLLIMWRLGLPTVVSSTPAYVRTMEAYGGPRWACQNEREWRDVLREALSNADSRKRAADLGAVYAEERYGVDALLGRWIAALETVVTEDRQPSGLLRVR